MISPVRRRHGIWFAFLLIPAAAAPAAENLTGAARDLARKTGQFLSRNEPVSVSYRNISSLGADDLAQLRNAFESGLRETGLRAVESAPADLRLTLSENSTDFVAVEELKHGEERQVWIAFWPRSGGESKAAALSLGKHEVWRQQEPVLDAAFAPAGMLVLSAAKVSLLVQRDQNWIPTQSAAIAPKPGVRDLRGRLRINGTGFQAFLPGLTCTGTTDPVLNMDCKPSEQPWLIESGTRDLLLATYAPSRNYFDGRVVTQAGARRSTQPFYSAAAAESDGRTYWLFALTDGRTEIADASFEPVDYISSWGSDIAGIESRCGAPTAILATRPGDAESDAVQAFRLSGRYAVPMGAPLSFSGPVTALWTSGGSSAIAVSREANSTYVAYLLTVSCD